MSAGTRYSQRIQNIAREKSYGMVKLAYDGRFLPSDEDKVSVSMEGPASPEKFELIRKFLWAFSELPNDSASDAVKKSAATKLREMAAQIEAGI